MNVHEMSQAELDAIAMKSDARQGEAVVGRRQPSAGRFVAYPSEHARVRIHCGLRTRHLMDAWELHAPNRVPLAEPASGKTRALEVSELLVPGRLRR